MRRVLASIVSVFLCGAMLAGCSAAAGSSAAGSVAVSSGSTAASGSAVAASGDVTTITFWCHKNEPWVKAYKAMGEMFAAANPGYKVEVQDYPFDVYNDKIQTALTSSTGGPDVIAVWGGKAPNFIQTDSLSEVPESLSAQMREDYMAPTLGIYQKDGKFYGVPMEYNLEYGGMVVNKKLFADAGLEYPTTWEELRSVSQEVSVQNGDIVEMKGFEMLDSDSLICNYLAMILQTGGQYLQEDNSINFATPEGIAAMEEILSMVKNGEADLRNLSEGEYSFHDVYQDKGFMASVGSWGIGEGTDTYGLTLGTDFDYIPVPQYGDSMGFASETGWGIIVPENSPNKEAAWKFVEFFSQPENLVQHNIACNQLPPRKSMLDSQAYKDALPNVAFLLDILPSGQWMGPYNTSDMRTIFNQMFIDLCQAENPDVEAALAAASEKITAECQIKY